MSNDLEIDVMRESASSVVTILKSLANTDRLLILCHLAQEELNVSQIEEKTQINQPTLSQQLTMLRKSNVVSTRRDGKQIYYSIKDEKLHIVLNTFSVHDKFHRTLILSGFCLLKIAKISLNSSFFPKPIKR